MKKLIAIAISSTAISLCADTRLPEYGQVAGVSNQIMAVDAKVSALTPSASYPQTANITFTIGGYIPTGDVLEQMLSGSAIKMRLGNNLYRYPLTTISVGTTVSTIVSVSGTARAEIEFECPTVMGEQLLCTKITKTIATGGNYTIPLTLRKAQENLFAIGRFQKIADTSTMESFLITRDCSTTDSYNPVTLFGYYENNGTTTTWVDETGIHDSHPLITDGTITGTQGDFETRIFPWAQAEKRTVTCGFTDSTAQNTYYFTWIPMYYWRLEDVTLPIRTHNSANDTWTTNNVACRVHWISKSQLPGFALPPWAYIHAYENGVWTTKGVKDGFYYARYDSVTKNNKPQSYPFSQMNDGYIRADIMAKCHALNAFTATVVGPTANSVVYSADSNNRMWAAPMYENYAPFRELAYIQFGASMKSVFYGGTRTNLNSLEAAFETAGESIKSFATGSGTASNFAWLYIWNPFYGCEGSVMSDASYVARKDDNGNTYGEWYVCPDRAADIGGATTIAALESAGAFKLAYTYNTTGKTNRESSRCIDETSQQSSIYWFPGATTDKCSVRVTDESGLYGGMPSTAGANVYGNWLSYYRGSAPHLGLWCVSTDAAPSRDLAHYWGSRPSFAPYRATGEAQSAE